MVKIPDFGLSKHLCKEEIYYKLESKNRKFPLRWMSIEAIENSIFSAKSDVVSFYILYFKHFPCMSNFNKFTAG